MGNTIANEKKDSMQDRLVAADAQNQPEIVQRLLAAGVDIETRDTHGSTALLLATHHNAVEAVRILIESGADVNAMDKSVSKPDSNTHPANRYDELRELKSLLDEGVITPDEYEQEKSAILSN